MQRARQDIGDIFARNLSLTKKLVLSNHPGRGRARGTWSFPHISWPPLMENWRWSDGCVGLSPVPGAAYCEGSQSLLALLRGESPSALFVCVFISGLFGEKYKQESYQAHCLFFFSKFSLM